MTSHRRSTPSAAPTNSKARQPPTAARPRSIAISAVAVVAERRTTTPATAALAAAATLGPWAHTSRNSHSYSFFFFY